MVGRDGAELGLLLGPSGRSRARFRIVLDGLAKPAKLAVHGEREPDWRFRKGEFTERVVGVGQRPLAKAGDVELRDARSPLELNSLAFMIVGCEPIQTSPALDNLPSATPDGAHAPRVSKGWMTVLYRWD